MGEHHLDKLRTQAMKALRLSHAGWWRFRYTEWKSFMWNFDGSLFSGPFSQLFVVLGQIGWRVVPPFLVVHDQCHLNLLGIDDSVPIPVLWDAWHGKWFLGKLCRACRCLTLTFWNLPPRI